MRYRSMYAVVALLMVGMIATAGFGSSRVTAQDVELGGDLVSGDCGSPGDSVGSLRALSEAEGGVYTSFTRVDVPIDDITGDDHAVVVTLDGDVVACGEVSGSGDDVYIAVASTSDEGYGGVAWLHARDDQTQVSLFIGEGLGGSGGGGENNNNGPEPPEDETPDAKPTRTPKGGDDETPEPTEAAGDETTYESPTFGYTVTYDDTWEVREEETIPSESGPIDYLNMFNGTSFATFRSVYAPDDVDMGAVADWLENGLSSAEDISSVESRTEAEVEDDSVIVAFDIVWTNSQGQEVESYVHYEARRIPGQGALVLFVNEGQSRSYEQQADARDALMDSLEIPD